MCWVEILMVGSVVFCVLVLFMLVVLMMMVIGVVV